MKLDIRTPTAIIDADIAKRNIARMAQRARQSGVRFRPHFKTHQSAAIGEWFRDEGVEAITVSSVRMAAYFAAHGWQDITVAFPVNWLEIEDINRLAAGVRLGLLVESLETVQFLQAKLSAPVRVWLKLDAGYGRTGIAWDDFARLRALGDAVRAAGKLTLAGLLTHAGQSYRATSHDVIRAVYRETVERMQAARSALSGDLELSTGDTPCCSVVEDLGEVDEIRPGNFVFYDVTQLHIGSCSADDVAMVVACPVVAMHPAANKIVVYGGGVHLSKESLVEDGVRHFGRVALLHDDGWGPPAQDSYVESLSQEHGILKVSGAFFRQVQIGDVVAVLPVHSCMSANLLKRYVTLDGDVIEMADIH